MAPYETFYGRKCRTPLCWDKVGERKLKDVELIETTSKKVKIIREWLKAAQDRQKSYANTQRKALGFEVGDMVFLKVAHWKGVIRFQKQGKLNPWYFGPFHIVEKIGPIAYQLELPWDLEHIHVVFHVSMLRKYISNPSHVLEAPSVELREDLSFEEQLVGIVHQRSKVLRNKVIPMVKVLWRNDRVEDNFFLRRVEL